CSSTPNRSPRPTPARSSKPRSSLDAMTQTNEGTRWRGINHLAMVTPDMDETVRFYHGVLGMRLVATLSAGPMRHYFFELGPQNTIAFFEWSRAETFAKPAGMPTLKFPMQ